MVRTTCGLVPNLRLPHTLCPVLTSLSQKCSQDALVTRLPHQEWAISWATTLVSERSAVARSPWSIQHELKLRDKRSAAAHHAFECPRFMAWATAMVSAQ